MVLAGCFSGDYSSGPIPPRTSTTVAETTVRGEVAVFSSSARVISLSKPVGGFASVIVSLDAQVLRSNGSAATVRDLVPGAGVEVTGTPGMSGILIARRIVLL